MSKHFNDDMSMGEEAHYYGAGDPRNTPKTYPLCHLVYPMPRNPWSNGMKVRVMKSPVGPFDGVIMGNTKLEEDDGKFAGYHYYVVPLTKEGVPNQTILKNPGAVNRYTFDESNIRLSQSNFDDLTN